MKSVGAFVQADFEHLNMILEGKHIKTLYQPVVSLVDGQIFGYEALSRVSEKSLEIGIEEMFKIADEMNKSWELELLCRTKAFENCLHKLNEKRLFLNVNPNILCDDAFKKGFTRNVINEYGLNPSNVIFEITEHVSVADSKIFLNSTRNYQSQNYEIAIDDVGSGYSGLNAIASVRPNYIKLDMGLVRNIDKDEMKLLLCKSIVDFGKNAGIKIIAEGIETEEELKVLIQLRIDYGQGYFLCVPQELHGCFMSEKIESIIKTHPSNCAKNTVNLVFPALEKVAKPGLTVFSNKKAGEIYETFNDKSNGETKPLTTAVAIVDNGVTLGFVTKSFLDKKLGGRFGFDLFSRKEILEVAEVDFLKLDHLTSVDEAADIAMQRPYERLYDPIVAEKDGRYLGVVTVKDLLDVCTKIQVESAIKAKQFAERNALDSEIAKERSEAAREAVMSSIEYASKIQKSLLPNSSIFDKIFSDYSIILNQRDIVGGDIYWVKEFDEGAVLCVCDCTGHGTPGAMLSMLVVSILELIVNEHNYKDANKIIWSLDQRLAKVLGATDSPQKKSMLSNINDGCDLAVLCISNDGDVSISSGHTHVFVCDGDSVTQIKGQKIYVGEGRLKNIDDVKVTNVPYNPDNKFYIASDGLFDQIGGESGLPFGYSPFKKLISDSHSESQSVISEKIWDAFEHYRGKQPRRDDVELITFRPQALAR